MKKDVFLNDEEISFDWEKGSSGGLLLTYGGKSFEVELVKRFDNFHSVISCNGRNYHLWHAGNQVSLGDYTHTIEGKAGRKKTAAGEEGGMVSPMPGKILKVMVEEGEEVVTGQSLLVMEAMKMEHTIKAPHDGKVIKVLFCEGDLVDGGVALIELEGSES